MGKGVRKEEEEAEYTIKPQATTPKLDTSKWPLLLKNYDRLNVRTGHYTPIPSGFTPLKRPLLDYIRYGVINLDKPANPSSHEVVAWIRRILRVEKTGHSGTLDPKARAPALAEHAAAALARALSPQVAGLLPVAHRGGHGTGGGVGSGCGRAEARPACGAGDRQPHRVRGARDAPGQVAAGRGQGVCVRGAPARGAGGWPGPRRARAEQPDRRAVPAAAAHLRRQAAAAHPHHLREPAAAVRRGAPAGRVLGVVRGGHLHPHAVRAPRPHAGRGRPHAGAALPTRPALAPLPWERLRPAAGESRVQCLAARLTGRRLRAQELRRVRSGIMGERNNMVTMHDVLDAQWVYDNYKDESYLRRIIMPLEVVLTNYKRLVVKDSAVNAICYGAKFMIPGLLRFENGVEVDDEARPAPARHGARRARPASAGCSPRLTAPTWAAERCMCQHVPASGRPRIGETQGRWALRVPATPGAEAAARRGRWCS